MSVDWPDAAREQFRVLEGWGLDPPITGAIEDLGGRGMNPRTLRPAVGQDVEGAAGA